MVALNGDGDSASIGDMRVRTFGVIGDANTYLSNGTNEFEVDSPLFELRLSSALWSSETEVAYAVRFTVNVPVDLVQQNIDDPGDPDSELPSDRDVIAQVDVPPPPEGTEQIALISTDKGMLSWLLWPGRDSRWDRTSYDVPRRVLGRDPELPNRAEVPRMSFVVRVLQYATSRFAGSAQVVSNAWESARRTQRFRTLTSTNFTDKRVPNLTDADWQRLSQGPALLFIHGTFSSTHGALRSAPRKRIHEWEQCYGERMFAWDHHTVGVSPRDNVQWAATNIPSWVNLKVDVVAHSRGGLVARELIERKDGPLIGRINVHTLVTLGTPHQGTPLADPSHVTGPLNVLSSLLLVSGQTGLALVVQLAKHAAIHGFDGAAGLTAMTPQGPYLRSLNNVPGRRARRYLPIASHFFPDHQSPVGRVVRDLALDSWLFRGEAHDLVVPIRSGLNAPTHGFIDTWRSEMDVCHSDYVRSPRLDTVIWRAVHRLHSSQEWLRSQSRGSGR
jgi:pimeloyl-ACP methyl ester carboxylesterase